MKLPEPNAAVELLAKATAVIEAISPGDATGYISEGFTLVCVCPTGDKHHPLRYALIWTTPILETDSRIRQILGV